MLIIPAIDIKEGKVVRFTKGRYEKRVYSNDPLRTAQHWQRQGAKLIHIVDLDGAAGGRVHNLDLLKIIAKEIKVPLQFGGGIRDKKTIEKLFDFGVYRVVIGTKAVEDKRFILDVFKQFKDRVIVSIDVRSGYLSTRGWSIQNRKQDPFCLAERLKQIGFKQLIYTDIERDGTLKGPNILGIKRILKAGLGLIASGGISSLEDILKLKSLEKQGLVGIIIGKALYEAKFTLRQAIKAV